MISGYSILYIFNKSLRNLENSFISSPKKTPQKFAMDLKFGCFSVTLQSNEQKMVDFGLIPSEFSILVTPIDGL